MTAPAFGVETPLVRLAVRASDGAVLEIRLNDYAHRGPESALERRVGQELVEYLTGKRREFTVAVKPAGPAFHQEVWRALLRIPYGQTASYGDVARTIGRPGAARAVGLANNRNPIPLIIPCHRVIAADGGLCGFGGGLELKRRLLEMEGAIPPALV